ncbi:hypothetical protein BJ170DRAFT_235757 [Xylariales sp. AK1849]|nr:hypothetical protein BJ170DRAFT_235757 [Xylariales sp. AK1849]
MGFSSYKPATWDKAETALPIAVHACPLEVPYAFFRHERSIWPWPSRMNRDDASLQRRWGDSLAGEIHDETKEARDAFGVTCEPAHWDSLHSGKTSSRRDFHPSNPVTQSVPLRFKTLKRHGSFSRDFRDLSCPVKGCGVPSPTFFFSLTRFVHLVLVHASSGLLTLRKSVAVVLFCLRLRLRLQTSSPSIVSQIGTLDLNTISSLDARSSSTDCHRWALSTPAVEDDGVNSVLKRRESPPNTNPRDALFGFQLR